MNEENPQKTTETPAAGTPNSSPKIFCKFAAFFALALPVFALAIDIATHVAWGNLAEISANSAAGTPSFAVKFLDLNGVFDWILFAAGAISAAYIWFLSRKNTAAGTLLFSGKIFSAFAISAILTSFYLGFLVLSVFQILLPLLKP